MRPTVCLSPALVLMTTSVVTGCARDRLIAIMRGQIAGAVGSAKELGVFDRFTEPSNG
jgi:hypothetical protein